jgi:hypothetical protein
MKSLKQYLTEAEKEYNYRIKFLGEVSDEQMEVVEAELRKYDLKTMKSPSKTIYQTAPMDFEEGVSGEVSIADFTTARPLSKDTVRDIIAQKLGIPETYVKVRSENDPLDDALVVEDDERTLQDAVTANNSNADDALLMNDYPADEHKATDYHGNDFNTKFVAELMKLVKQRDTHVSNYMDGE